MPCWNNTAKIAIGSSIVGAATIAMIVIIFTAASWTTPVLWIELIGIGIIGLIGLLWIVIIAVQHRGAMRRQRNQALGQMEGQQENPPQQALFRPTRAPQLPTTGYSPKLRDENKIEIDAKEFVPPASPPEESAGADARVPIPSEEESTVSEAADKPYYNKQFEA